MDISLFEQMRHDGIIDDHSLQKIKACDQEKVVSVHSELKTLLYAGILCLTTGLGILIYKNIDSIGHLAIILFIAAASGACFVYCLKKSAGFSFEKVHSPNVWFDYVLLLGCLLMLSFLAYLQFQYGVFGQRWGLALFFPMIILFAAAYYFDHLGVLSMAITNLAAWAGITITPVRFLENNDADPNRIIYTGLLLGVLLVLLSLASVSTRVKPHFSFTYRNFGTHLLFISLLAAITNFDQYYFLWFLLMTGVAVYHYLMAKKEKSLYFLVVTTLYFYVAISYVIIRSLLKFSSSEGALYLTLLYLIGSAIGLIFFLIHQNKSLKTHAGI